MVILHKIEEFYQIFYSFGKRIPKSDKLGIYSKIENLILDLLELIISASLEAKIHKLPLLNSARLKVEVIKRLVRFSSELQILSSDKYLVLEARLQEISKMLNGWRAYANK